MKNKIKTDKIWIDVETLAILKNITKRAVRLSLNKNKYEYIIEFIPLEHPQSYKYAKVLFSLQLFV